ncbi:MAG: cytochrome c biogenesis protein [Acidobacteriota bacterium]
MTATVLPRPRAATRAFAWSIADAALLLSVPLMAWGLYRALVVAPTEATLGDSQRIFYVHVPCAWAGFLGFLIVGGAGALYLATGREAFDRAAQAACEVGVLFTTLVLVTGPIWAKNDWGVYWTWDARLTSTFVLWLTYVGYLMIRINALDPGRIRRVLAIYGIVAFLDVPFVYYSIQWFRTQHPAPVIGARGGGLAPEMRGALFTCGAAFLLLFAGLVARRARLLRCEDEIQEMKAASRES